MNRFYEIAAPFPLVRARNDEWGAALRKSGSRYGNVQCKEKR